MVSINGCVWLILLFVDAEQTDAMELRQFRKKYQNQSDEVEEKVCWIVFCVETSQDESILSIIRIYVYILDIFLIIVYEQLLNYGLQYDWHCGQKFPRGRELNSVIDLFPVGK